MRKIDISINKAEILGFNVEYLENEPKVEVNIGLFTAGGRQISTYTISTNAWTEERKFKLPTNLILPIKGMLAELEIIAVKHCNQGLKKLE